MARLPFQLKKILRFVYHNRFSDFYRKKFDVAGININKIDTLEKFKRLPFTAKAEIVAAPPCDILFLPLNDVDFVRYSSGTSGKGLSVSYRGYSLEKRASRILAPLFKKTRHIFILLGSPGRALDQYCRFRYLNKITVVGDAQNLEASAALAQKAKTDAISSTPTLALLFAAVFKKYSDTSRFKVVYLHGEPLTPLKFQAIREEFPGALIFQTAGATELEGIFAYQCAQLASKKEYISAFHPAPWFYFEIIAGEIVVSSLEKRPLTLLRYKTGDGGYLEKKRCSCGRRVSLIIQGRIGGDAIKAGGFELRKNIFGESLSLLQDKVKAASLHLYEEKIGAMVKPKIVFEVVLQEEFEPSSSLGQEILAVFKNTFWVSQKHNIFDAVRAGLMLEPEIKFSENAAPLSQIVDHRF